MKEQLLGIVGRANDKLNILREYLQSYILFSLQKHKFFQHNVFVGGTCLRFVSDLPRFSEDLDFSMTSGRIDLAAISHSLHRELEAAGYRATVKERSDSTVVSIDISFCGLLHEARITPDPRKKAMIRLEIDTRPPKGNTTRVTLSNRYFPLALKHNDLETLLAGKLNALFTRSFTKGRDYFDVFWLLSRNKVAPNLGFLRNALRQRNSEISAENWKTILIEKIQTASWKQVVNDVAPFLEFPGLEEAFTRETLLSLLLPRGEIRV